LAFRLFSSIKIFVEIMPIRILSRNGYSRNGYSEEDVTEASRTRRENGSQRRWMDSEIARHSIDQKNSNQKNSKTKSGIPGWVPWAGGAIGLAAIVYGLLQLDGVQKFLKNAADSVGDFFSGDEFEPNGYSSRCYDSDFSIDGSGSILNEDLRSQL
jgi:hypothetical protein